MHIALLKTMAGFIPADPKTDEFYRKLKLGTTIHSDFKQMRNAAFHRKAFALFNLAFEYWEPGEVSSKYGTPEKNFDRFRKDLTILAGHYHNVIRLDGTVRVEADSLSFGSMSQETFEELYNNVLDVILKRIPVLSDMTKEEIDELVNKVLAFS
jgi:hypothetical protein